MFHPTGIHPDSCDPSCLAYNYDQIIEIFQKFNCVLCYLSGHAHKSGYSIDETGIHYIVLHGIIETDPLNDAFVTITIKKDVLIVDGKGSEKSLVLPIKKSKIDAIEIQNESIANKDANEGTDKFSEYDELSAVVEVSV